MRNYFSLHRLDKQGTNLRALLRTKPAHQLPRTVELGAGRPMGALLRINHPEAFKRYSGVDMWLPRGECPRKHWNKTAYVVYEYIAFSYLSKRVHKWSTLFWYGFTSTARVLFLTVSTPIRLRVYYTFTMSVFIGLNFECALTLNFWPLEYGFCARCTCHLDSLEFYQSIDCIQAYEVTWIRFFNKIIDFFNKLFSVLAS